MAEKLHEAERIRARDGNKRTIRGYQAVGNQTVQMGMKPGGIVAVALQRGDHTGDRAAIASGILEEFLDRSIETLAQQPEELAVVLEAEAQHFGNRDDVLADRKVAKDLLVDVFGKEQGPLLVARGAETPSAATIWQ